MGDQPAQPNFGNFSLQVPDVTSSSFKLSSSDDAGNQNAQHDSTYKQSTGSHQQAGSPSHPNHIQQQRHSSQLQGQDEQAARTGQPAEGFLNMGSLGGPLLELGYHQGYATQSSQSPYLASSQHTGSQYQTQQGPQYPAHNVQYLPPYQQVYGQQQQQQQQQQGQRSMHRSQNHPQQYYQYSQQPQQLPAYYYQPNPGQIPQFGQGSFQQAQYARGSFPGDPSGGVLGGNDFLGSVGQVNPAFGIRSSSIVSIPSSNQPSVPRGPPRKPKQSGHALWVGNLPPTANVIDLKDHFSREATEDILSVFLISKSNCAFVNYKTEEACAAAMARFHDSRFRDTRLVCRLRRIPASGVPTGPAALSTPAIGSSQPESPLDSSADEALSSAEVAKKVETAQDRYFIVKSLTVEDLELSARNGQWATQSHNEGALNKAFESAESVYLIFSANKSGEYFGYAKMISRINEDPAVAIEFAPKSPAILDPEQPKATPTQATEFAPKGRIIDDSARGTIFWEAETGEDENSGDAEEEQTEELEGEAAKAWGKPFKIEWQSTNRLPFYRTRGLRNPWNSNREVKIARDGTELETSIGRRLVQMFHREQQAAPPQLPIVPMPQMGYPPMRPY